MCLKGQRGPEWHHAGQKGTTVSALCFHNPVAACTVTHLEPDTTDNYDMTCLDAIGAGQARTWKYIVVKGQSSYEWGRLPKPLLVR